MCQDAQPCYHHHFDPKELQIIRFNESNSRTINASPKHYVCGINAQQHHALTSFRRHKSNLPIATHRPSTFFNHLNHIKQYQKDEEIQNLIKTLKSIMNAKRATILLALILLSKYRSNYQR